MQIEDDEISRIADFILRQVVCTCGNYRHHGVIWMPEGSGNGRSATLQVLRSLVTRSQRKNLAAQVDELTTEQKKYSLRNWSRTGWTVNIKETQ